MVVVVVSSSGRNEAAAGQQHWGNRFGARIARAVHRLRSRLPQLGEHFRPLSRRTRRLSSITSTSTSTTRRRAARTMPPHVSKRAERQMRRCAPLLLVLSLCVYALLGAAAFLFFEHTNHEQTVRKWFFNLIVNRHKFARQISSAIFNGTRNMLVIVDYDSSERIQRDIVHLLSQYEHQLSLRMPDLNEWTLENSLAYAWGLLTTVGHGQRSPKTWGGQVFALFYCLLGVPFFVITLIIVSHRLFELCRDVLQFVEERRHRSPPSSDHHLVLTLLVTFLYISWLLMFGTILYATSAISESYWRSLSTAVLSSLTIQSADYNALSERHKLLTLGCASLSLMLSCVGILSLTGIYRYGRRGAERRRVMSGQPLDGQKGAAPRDGLNNAATTTPKFQVIVDEVGDTKLAGSNGSSSASPPPPDAVGAKGSIGKIRRSR